MTSADLVWAAPIGLSLPKRSVTWAAEGFRMIPKVPAARPVPNASPLLSALLRVSRPFDDRRFPCDFLSISSLVIAVSHSIHANALRTTMPCDQVRQAETLASLRARLER